MPDDKPTKLLNKNFLILWQGQLISQIGSQMHGIAMMFWLKHATNSATLMGTLSMVSMLPAVILGPLGGALADRYSRRKIIILGDLISGLVVLILAGMLFYFPDKTGLIIVWLAVSYTIMGTVASTFQSAISASIPDLVPRDKIAGANSLNRGSAHISSFIGMGGGGVLFRVLGAPLLFLFDAISYFYASFSMLFARTPQIIPEKTSGAKETILAFKNDLKAGVRYVWTNKGLRNMVLTASLLNFISAPIGVLFPFFVEDFLHKPSDWFGYLIAAMGVGSLIGYLLAGAVKIPGKRRAFLLASSIFANSLGVITLGFMVNAWYALCVIFIIGIFNGFININLSTIIQSTVPSEIRGRVFGLLGTLSGGLLPVGMALAGMIADLTDKNVPLLFGISGGISALLTIFIFIDRETRIFLAYDISADKSAKDRQSSATKP